ncbi:unnamed protein product [Ectocarpus sp. CCAP 1310/34]|nr:unnamed protein product [Ectocarpus sp. CCAP 1310/34]
MRRGRGRGQEQGRSRGWGPGLALSAADRAADRGGDAGVNLYVVEGAERAGTLLPFTVGVKRAVGGSPREEVLLERGQCRHRVLVGDGCGGSPRPGCYMSARGAAR